ncbi:MAG: hypothetical protein M3063_05640 [Actinomycetota bacterium]|nr:hypothetical protein [Actinomycetota bacterium]
MAVVSTGGLRERSGAVVFRRTAPSANTLLAYRRDWDRFSRWCARHGVSALLAEAGWSPPTWPALRTPRPGWPG